MRYFLLITLALLAAAAAQAKMPRGCAPADIRFYEAAFGVTKGGYKTIPQLGFTIQYLGTEARANGVCAILVRRAD